MRNAGSAIAGRGRPANVLALLLVILLALAVTIASQAVVHWRENSADSHLFGYYGWEIAHGARPYLDTWDNKPPGIWWLNAAAFRLLGDSAGVDYLVGGAGLFAALLAAAGIIATLWHRTFLLIAFPLAVALLTDLQFECGANRTETWVVAAEMLGVFAYIRWLSNRRTRWLIAAGVCLGAAPWFKQSGLGALTACALHFLLYCRPLRRAELLAALGGLAAASAAALLLLTRDGAIGAAWFAIVRFNQRYFDAGDAGWLGFTKTRDLLGPHLAPVGWCFALAAIGAALPLARRIRGLRGFLDAGPARTAAPASASSQGAARFRGVTLLFVIWLLAALAAVSLAVGRLAYHLMVVLPPLAMLAALGVAGLLGIARKDECPGNLIAALVQSPRRTALATLVLAIAGGVAAGSLREGARFAANRPAGAGWFTIAAPPGFARQARLIQRLTGADDSIYVWGWSPGSYRYSYRRCSSRFATIEKVGQLREQGRFILDAVINALETRPPAIFMISPNDLDALLKQPRDRFAEWIGRAYERIEEVNGMWIMRWNGKQAACIGFATAPGICTIALYPGTVGRPFRCPLKNTSSAAAIRKTRSNGG